ncbi:MAG: hypothetical protein CMN21_04660 [Rubinisphaera sp.]|nr:hypothetical protein [Rubinisphaera sp.]
MTFPLSLWKRGKVRGIRVDCKLMVNEIPSSGLWPPSPQGEGNFLAPQQKGSDHSIKRTELLSAEADRFFGRELRTEVLSLTCQVFIILGQI